MKRTSPNNIKFEYPRLIDNLDKIEPMESLDLEEFFMKESSVNTQFELPPGLRMVEEAPLKLSDPLLTLAGTVALDVTDVSERHDEYIADELVSKHE